MGKRKLLLIFLGCTISFILWPAAVIAQQPVQKEGAVGLESVLEKDSILIGDQVWWQMSLPKDSWKDKKIETATFPDPPFDVTEGIEALSRLKLDSVIRRRRVENITAKILITSFDSGSYQLPHMPVYLTKKDGTTDTLWFKGPDLYVNTIPIDTTSYEPYGIKPQMRYPVTWTELLTMAAGLLVLTGVVLLLIQIVKRRRDNLPIFGLGKPKDPPHVAALKVLKAIKEQELWKKQKAKPYYTLLTDTLRLYLKGTWRIQAIELTSAEMLASLRSEQSRDALLTEEVLGKLSSMLTTGDLAKFAKYTPSHDENEEALLKAIHFVVHTVVKEEEETKEE